MPVTPISGVADLLLNKTHRFAHCWKITRTDGEIVRVTDHNGAITLEDDDETYVPAPGMSASAVRRHVGLKSTNRDASGILDTALITEEDLRLGRYRYAQVDERLVDWRYPWAGDILLSTYWIRRITYNEGAWYIELAGLTDLLRQPTGQVYNTVCRHALGDTQCGYDTDAVKQSAKVVNGVTDTKRVFTADVGVLGEDTGWADSGLLTWLTGDNAGLQFEVKSYTKSSSTGTYTLHLPTPEDIVITTDTFDCLPGCDKAASTCEDDFSNIINFGGFPFLPGTEQLYTTGGSS